MGKEIQEQALEMMKLAISYRELIIPITIAFGVHGMFSRLIHRIKHHEDVEPHQKATAIQRNKFSKN